MGRHTPEENAKRRARYAADPDYRAQKKAKNAAWRAANPGATLERVRAWREANPERKRASARRRQGMIDPPGEARTGSCQTCPYVGPLVCDHDHATGKVRGWLCNGCNCALGYVRDSAQTLGNLKTYLEESQ